MKQTIILCTLAFIFFQCKHEVTTSPKPVPASVFRIDLQSGFSNTPVVVYVDQSQVFADTVSTNIAVSVAAIIPVQINQGIHTLGIVIPNSVSKDTSFLVPDSLYVGVGYSALKGTIDFIFWQRPFPYR
jgi:hypothetical protein